MSRPPPPPALAGHALLAFALAAALTAADASAATARGSQTPAAAPASPAAGAAAQPPAQAPDWGRDAIEYLRDPRRSRRLVRGLAGRDPDTLPPLLQLVLADARFHAGQDRAAAALADRLLLSFPDARGSTARLLLASIAFANGDVTRLEELQGPLASFAPPFGQAVAVLHALAASGDGPAEAATALGGLALARRRRAPRGAADARRRRDVAAQRGTR